MTETVAAVVMAAGKSTRMKSGLPKAAHPICGKPITRWVIDACREAGVEEIVVVVGHQAGAVMECLGDDVAYAEQTVQLGTGHACMQAMPLISPEAARVLALPGDAPLVTARALRALISAHAAEGAAAALLSAVLDDPAAYGRVIRGSDGAVLRILEAKDADEKTLGIREINASIYCFDRRLLEDKLSLITTENAQGEYYLTDVIELLNASGHRVSAVIADNPADTLGINNRAELAQAASILRQRILERLMLSGVSIVDPATTYIDWDVEIGPDTVINPCTVIEHGTRIGANCRIGPFAHLRGVTIPDNSGEAGC